MMVNAHDQTAVSCGREWARLALKEFRYLSTLCRCHSILQQVQHADEENRSGIGGSLPQITVALGMLHCVSLAVPKEYHTKENIHTYTKRYITASENLKIARGSLSACEGESERKPKISKLFLLKGNSCRRKWKRNSVVIFKSGDHLVKQFDTTLTLCWSVCSGHPFAGCVPLQGHSKSLRGLVACLNTCTWGRHSKNTVRR